jgi:hypothetical protein
MTNNMISRDEARTLVGKMLFGSDWISDLTKEQKVLLDGDFGPKRRPVFQRGVMVNTIDVFEKPCPADRRQEFDIAIGRLMRMGIQIMTVDDWIETAADLDITKKFIDRDALDAAMADYRRQENDATCASKSSGPRPIERNRVVDEMKKAIASGTSVQALREMKQIALADLFSTGRETARNALAEVLSKLEAAGTPTNSDMPE